MPSAELAVGSLLPRTPRPLLLPLEIVSRGVQRPPLLHRGDLRSRVGACRRTTVHPRRRSQRDRPGSRPDALPLIDSGDTRRARVRAPRPPMTPSHRSATARRAPSRVARCLATQARGSTPPLSVLRERPSCSRRALSPAHPRSDTERFSRPWRPPRRRRSRRKARQRQRTCDSLRVQQPPAAPTRSARETSPGRRTTFFVCPILASSQSHIAASSGSDTGMWFSCLQLADLPEGAGRRTVPRDEPHRARGRSKDVTVVDVAIAREMKRRQRPAKVYDVGSHSAPSVHPANRTPPTSTTSRSRM
jgi:hypothetical protein